MTIPQRVERTLVVLFVIATILVAVIAFASAFAGSPPSSSRPLSFEDRLAAQRAIEEVYWSHRIWPAENGAAKPPLDAVLSPSAIRSKVEDYLRRSFLVESILRQPITAARLQAEMDRMAGASRSPDVLRELFAALDDDPFLIAECLARPILVDRLFRSDEPGAMAGEIETPSGEYTLPAIATSSCAKDTWTPTSIPYSPHVRAYHSAVWTGSEMIVWGGNDYPNVMLDSGGRYDPVTDVWTPTSTGANTPSKRFNHAAVWTGSEMIVWGGTFCDDYTDPCVLLDDGGRYDPLTDSWQPVSAGAGAPEGRQNFTSVWTGTEMIVWGGNTASGGFSNTGGRYDPSSDTWIPTGTGPDVPGPRLGHAAVWTGSVMIVWGGTVSPGDVPTDTGGRYDPSSDSWSPTSTGANVPEARAAWRPFMSRLPAVWTGSEMIVWGGVTYSSLDTKTGARYNPVTDTWLPTVIDANTPYSAPTFGMSWTGSELVIVATWGCTPYSGRYSPATDSWVPVGATPDLQCLLYAFSQVFTGTEVIVFGGEDQAHENNGLRYNPAADLWTPTGNGDIARARHTAVWTGAEMIVWSGDSYDYFTGSGRTGARYAPATDSWTMTSQGASVPAGRERHTAVWTGTEMVVWGGISYGAAALGGRYNPLTDSWGPISETGAPEARLDHTAVWTGGEMLVWGGRSLSANAYLNTGGRYDPLTDTWKPTSLLKAPEPRDRHAAVWTGKQMIVWGGDRAGRYKNTGGRYNPLTDAWTATSTASGVPRIRADHTAVWTGKEMIVWGGMSTTGYQNTGARYDPAANKWTATSAGPGVASARALHTAVWTGSEMLVWGGSNVSGPRKVGSRYDPASNTWSPMNAGAGAPTARIEHTAVITGHQMIAWGGSDVMTGRLDTGGLYCYAP